jgi:PAS domain S-box-containing protein
MAIRDELQALENLLLYSSDVLCALEPNGHLWQVSAAGQRVLGYAPQELAGTPFDDLLHPVGGVE